VPQPASGFSEIGVAPGGGSRAASPVGVVAGLPGDVDRKARGVIGAHWFAGTRIGAGKRCGRENVVRRIGFGRIDDRENSPRINAAGVVLKVTL